MSHEKKSSKHTVIISRLHALMLVGKEFME